MQPFRYWEISVRHDVELQVAGYGLRPVADGDAGIIASLRAASERTRYLHATEADPAAQREWLRQYYDRAGDWYFAVVNSATSAVEGFAGIYDHQAHNGNASAEWGRWVLREGSLAAPACALMIYRAAFLEIGVRELYCRTVVENAAVVSFHDRCLPDSRRSLPVHFELGGRRVDAIEHRFSAASLPRIEHELSPLARLIERRRNRGTA